MQKREKRAGSRPPFDDEEPLSVLLISARRDSFGENEDSCLLHLQERFLQQERAGMLPPSYHSASSAETTTNRTLDDRASQLHRRKNYIIFEQNDEDTLI